MMKIVIDIPDQKYKWIIENPQTYTDELHDAIRNGTLLPEHHGRLIDADAFEQCYNGVKSELKQPCEDCISREAVKDMITETWIKYVPMELDVNLSFVLGKISELPSVTPKFTDVEIQKMQELEQAQLEKTYELGKTEMQPCEDCISRLIVQEEITKSIALKENPHQMYKRVQAIPSVTPQQARWIPVSERLPEDLETVNVTWVNHEPEPYYHDIKDKSFVATAIFSKRTGHWYWYSTTCADYLGEYGDNEIDKVDDAIEIIAWMPLPQPYEESEKEK